MTKQLCVVLVMDDRYYIIVPSYHSIHLYIAR